jgi:hypothetical protein
MSLHSDTLFWSVYMVFLLNAACLAEKQQIHLFLYNFIVFYFTRWGLEPTIYHTRGEHVNQTITPPMEN